MTEGGLLGFATGAYGEASTRTGNRFHPRGVRRATDRRRRGRDANCVDGLVESRARGLLQLFQRKGLLPRTLKFFAALGDLDAVRTALDKNGNDLAAVNERSWRVPLRARGRRVSSCWSDPSRSIPSSATHRRNRGPPFLRQAPSSTTDLRMSQRSACGRRLSWSRSARVLDGDLTAFVGRLQREPWLLGEACVEFQAGLIGTATLNDRGEFITALLDLDPAILRRQPPPPSQAIEFALTYANTHLIPLLTRIWPLPDDLPHAAGMGNLSRVKHWFDEPVRLRWGTRESRSLQRSARAEHLQWDADGAAGPRHGARLVRHQPSLRRGGLPARTRRQHQHQLELP